MLKNNMVFFFPLIKKITDQLIIDKVINRQGGRWLEEVCRSGLQASEYLKNISKTNQRPSLC